MKDKKRSRHKPQNLGHFMFAVTSAPPLQLLLLLSLWSCGGAARQPERMGLLRFCESRIYGVLWHGKNAKLAYYIVLNRCYALSYNIGMHIVI